MDRSAFAKAERYSALFVPAACVICHFLYRLTGETPPVGLFCPVSESVWEHGKLLFFPFLLAACAECALLHPPLLRFWAAKSCALLLGPALMIAFYYTYTGVFGVHSLWVDIASCFAWVLVMFAVSRRLMQSGGPAPVRGLLCCAGAVALCVLFSCLPLRRPLCRCSMPPKQAAACPAHAWGWAHFLPRGWSFLPMPVLLPPKQAAASPAFPLCMAGFVPRQGAFSSKRFSPGVQRGALAGPAPCFSAQKVG